MNFITFNYFKNQKKKGIEEIPTIEQMHKSFFFQNHKCQQVGYLLLLWQITLIIYLNNIMLNNSSNKILINFL